MTEMTPEQCDDARSVRFLTTAINQLIGRWAEADDAVRRELWQRMAATSDDVFDRFHDRFIELDRRFANEAC